MRTMANARYLMVKAVTPSSFTLRGALTGAESSTMHLARDPGFMMTPRTTLCGKGVKRVMQGEWKPSEASCRECKRLARVG
jgi:hypothetical protein